MQRPAKGIKITGVLGPAILAASTQEVARRVALWRHSPFAVRCPEPFCLLLVVCWLALSFSLLLRWRNGLLRTPQPAGAWSRRVYLFHRFNRRQHIRRFRGRECLPDSVRREPSRILSPFTRAQLRFFATACSSAHGFSGSGQPGGSIMDGGRTTVLIGVGDLTAAARLSLPMGMVFTITSSYPHMNIQRTSTFPETATWCGFNNARRALGPISARSSRR